MNNISQIEFKKSSYLPVAKPFITPQKITPDLAFEELLSLAQSYLNIEDIPKLKAAYHVALESHAGQLRKSGEAYIVHPLQVACFAAEMKLDSDALVAAILHDCVEDSHLTLEAVSQQFGKTVAVLVDGLTKIAHLKLASREEQQAENFRKMLLAMSQDLRVMLIKLCDRSHNMRTLASLDTARQKRIAQETMDIFAPLAHRLGLNPLYRELQNLSFAYLKPMRYRILDNAVQIPRKERSVWVEQTRKKLQEGLSIANITAQVQGRDKDLYSIYRKMERKHIAFDKVNDILGLRVVVNSESDCYLALGIIHKLYKPQPGKFKDFIALPKPNRYQSLHTGLIGEHGIAFEVQIRSVSMHRVAENGVAAHWMYKNQLVDTTENAISWVRELLELDAGGGAREFLEHVKADLFPDHVYIFTPQGKIITLPKGSTALDFAYSIHTDVGNTCHTVDINDVRVSLRTILRTGDTVAVHTSAFASPSSDWVGFVKTAKARSEIRYYLRSLSHEAIVQIGHTLLISALKQLSIEESEITSQQWQVILNQQLPTLQQQTDTTEITPSLSPVSLYKEIGLGHRQAILVAQSIAILLSQPVDHPFNQSTTKQSNPSSIVGEIKKPLKPLAIAGMQGLGLQYAPCCLPIPGDGIVGRLNNDGRLMVHTHHCKTMLKSKVKYADAWLELNWGDTQGETFYTRVIVKVKNGKGVLATVAAAITDSGCHISQVRTEDEPGNTAMMSFYIAVNDRNHLATVYRNLRRVSYTLDIKRDGH